MDLLGTSGLRSLTHARVDARAGLPPGSTSNYFRTREALLIGVVEHMVSAEAPAVDAAVLPRTADDLATELTRLFEFLMGPNKTMTTARMVLLLEASHDDALRAALAAGRTAMERAIMPTLIALGAPEPRALMAALAAAFEGMFLHRIARHADWTPSPSSTSSFEAVSPKGAGGKWVALLVSLQFLCSVDVVDMLPRNLARAII